MRDASDNVAESTVWKRIARPSLHPLWVFAISGAAGFRIGYVSFPTWHVAVQTAQVLAGIVHFPRDNPEYIYHTKLWTLLHQLIAPLLMWGVSERQVSLLLSGVLGMLAFQALALVTFALSRNALLAIGAAFLVFYTRAAEHGVTYPVFLMGTEHTYGSVGLSLAVLIVGLFGSGCWRLGGVLLGVMPAVHPSIGAWLWLITLIAAATLRWRASREIRLTLPYVVTGAAITFASLAVQLRFIYDVPAVDPQVTRPYLDAFTTYWDGHRQAVNPTHPGVIFNAVALVIALLGLRGFASRLSIGASLLLRTVVVSACVGLSVVALSHIPPERLPLTLLTLMPARLLNLNVMLFVPLLFGVFGLIRREGGDASSILPTIADGPAILFAMLALSLGLLVSQFSMLWDPPPTASWWPAALGRPNPVLVIEAAAILACSLLLLAMPRSASGGSGGSGSVRNALPEAAVLVAVAAVMLFAAVQSWRLRPHEVLRDWTNDPLYAVAKAEPEGVMAVGGGFNLAQLQTRRPVVINPGGLDAVSYAPESAPALARVLRDVYDIDLVHPPAAIPRGAGAIPPEFNRRVWEGFSRAKWQEIRQTYNITQVLTPGNYELDLPVIAQSGAVRLYAIPPE